MLSGGGTAISEVADLAQHEQAVVRLVAQRLDPEDELAVDGAGQHERLAAEVIGGRTLDDVVAAGEADDVLGIDSHGALCHLCSLIWRSGRGRAGLTPARRPIIRVAVRRANEARSHPRHGR